MNFPRRKRLPHDVPLWVDPNREIYFITVCCEPRNHNQLARDEVASVLFETVAFRNQNYLWFAHLFLLMPDHLHALMSFPPAIPSDGPLGRPGGPSLPEIGRARPPGGPQGRARPPGAPLGYPTRTIKSVISKWKEWTAKRLGITWQRDFFEHRLRREESRRQKADYILENPVRKGLVARAEDWPYVWFPDGLRPQFAW